MKKLIKYFSLTSISGDISEYGYSFSLRKYIISIIGVTGFYIGWFYFQAEVINIYYA